MCSEGQAQDAVTDDLAGLGDALLIAGGRLRPGLPGWVGGRRWLQDGADGERPRERGRNRLRRGLGGEEEWITQETRGTTP